GPDESALEVGMDCARRLWRFGPLRDGPGPRLLRPNSEIGHQMQERITRVNQAIEAGLLEPDRFEKFRPCARRQSRDLRFDFSGVDYRDCAFLCGPLLNLAGIVVARGRSCLIDIAGI